MTTLFFTILGAVFFCLHEILLLLNGKIVAYKSMLLVTGHFIGLLQCNFNMIVLVVFF